ncbi:MAG: hypothetical protein PUP92_19325 [Rhizonema sp. PD38]|nr:hypothetical protein [Rhizonema sp. PD38]
MITIFCAFCLWIVIFLLIYSGLQTLSKGTNYVKMLHEIPCAGCEYFTNDYRLKCTVHPHKACSLEAINCVDFMVKTASCNATQKGQHKPCYSTCISKRNARNMAID